jgi:tetratricopeptide (TPR) repeat protein
MTMHFDYERLLVYSLAPDSHPLRAEIRAHLGACRECAMLLDDIHREESELRQPATWEIAERVSVPTLDSLHALQERIAREDEEANTTLKPLLDKPSSVLRVLLSRGHQRERFRTGGAVRLFVRMAHERCEKEPLDAAAFAEVAVKIAEHLPDNHYPADGVFALRGDAWKERANALRYLGEYRRAHQAINRAESAYRRLAPCDLHVAVARYVRGTILWKSEDFDAALVELDAALATFVEYGDRVRERNTRLIQANIRSDRGEVKHALSTWQLLLADTSADEPLMRARLLLNMGSAELETRQLQAARAHIEEALALFAASGVLVEAARARWNLARLTLADGETESALVALRFSHRELAQLGATSDAVVALLHVIEALIACDRASEVPAVARNVLAYCGAAGMRAGALTAAGYLREAARNGVVTPALLLHIQRFFRRLEDQPTVLYTPPES